MRTHALLSCYIVFFRLVFIVGYVRLASGRVNEGEGVIGGVAVEVKAAGIA